MYIIFVQINTATRCAIDTIIVNTFEVQITHKLNLKQSILIIYKL